MPNFAGDVCILISESAPESVRPDWQVDLRDRFGGVCATPIHLTLQRIPAVQSPSETEVVTATIQALSGAVPCLYPGETAPITILELMNPPDAGWQHSGDAPMVLLAEPVGANLDMITVSRIRAPFDYEIMASWRVGENP